MLQPVRPPPAFVETITFAEPIATRPSIDHALDALLEPLCRALTEAGQGARGVTLRAFRLDRDVQEITIGTGRADAQRRRICGGSLRPSWSSWSLISASSA